MQHGLTPDEKKAAIATIYKQMELVKDDADKLKSVRSSLKDTLNGYRQEIRESSNKETALARIALYDGEISVPVILQILEDIRQTNDKEIDVLLQKMIASADLAKLTNTTKIEYPDAFEKYGKNILDTFKEATKVAIGTVTPASVQKFSDEMIQTIANRHPLLKFSQFASSPDHQLLLQRLRLEVYLVCANYVYERSDWEQRESTGSVIARYVKSAGFKLLSIGVRDLIEARFKMLNMLAKQIYLDENQIQAWDELALWLEGLYLRTESLYPASCRDENGLVKKDTEGNYLPAPNDDQDKALYNYKVTKIYMSLTYYRPVSNMLRQMLVEADPQKKLFYKEEKQPEPETKESDSMAPVSPTKPVSVVSDAKPTKVEPEVSSSSPAVSGLFKKLSGHREQPDAEKIRQLQRHLQAKSLSAELTSKEQDDLESAVVALKTVAQGYIDNAGYFLKKTNLHIAREIVAIIDNSKFEAHEKITQIIQKRYLMALKSSTDLLPEVDKALLHLYDDLIEEQNDAAPAVRRMSSQ